jgi:CDP-glycerol glycerophosphotransferase (TagB/SpsB family)
LIKKIFSFRGFATILKPVVWIFDFLVPVKENLWIFVIGPGKFWQGNLRALYEYVFSNFKEIQPVILVADRNNNINNFKVGEIVYARSLKGLWVLSRSSTIIVQYHCHDFIWKGITKFNHFIVNLWHGMTLKGVGFTSTENFVKKYGRLFKSEGLSYDLIIACSKMDQLLMSASFQIPSYKVKITGFPRNDWLIMKKSQLPSDLRDIETSLSSKLNGRSFIVYAPTFRENKSGVYNFSNKELRELSSFLEDNKALMGIRPHMYFEYNDFLNKSPYFLNLSSKTYVETQILLRLTSVLITDYSSIWVDFLLLKRPVIAFVYDLDKYKKERGLNIDYGQFFPGPIIHKFPDLIVELEKALNNDMPGFLKRKYDTATAVFHNYKECGASVRIVREILESKKI